VDGVELRKPILLPSPIEGAKPGDDPLFDIIEVNIDRIVAGSRLHVVGYIYAQQGQSVYPPELRGLLLRVRDVAIGGYDRSLLSYPYVEGPRFDWITCELYALEGLEQALTASRDSFDSLHAHYEQLQVELLPIFRDLFRKLWAGIEQRTAARREVERKDFVSELPSIVEKAVGFPIEIQFVDADGPQVEFDKERRILRVNERAGWPRSQRRRVLLQKAVIAFEVARTTGSTPGETTRIFNTIISALL
jgi:hypothetical protein